MKFDLLTFSTSDWVQTTERYLGQIEAVQRSFGFFDMVTHRTEKDLSPEWHAKFGRYTGEHGYGLWSWKPYVIAERLESMPDGDALLYTDIGCSMPQGGIRKIRGRTRFACRQCLKVQAPDRGRAVNGHQAPEPCGCPA